MTRLRGRLDHLVSAHVHRGLDSLDPTVHELLRIGAYQLLYMDGVPDYAAVSSTVDRVRRHAGPRPAGFVNAVLRKVGAAGDGLERFPSFDSDPATFLSTWGSHPEWLVARWLARWSPEEVRALVEADNRRPRTCIVAPGKDPRDVLRTLEERGIAAESVGGGSGCVRLDTGEAPSAAIAAVPGAMVQDPGAHWVVLYSDVPRGTKVADLCAAPGGKALAASDRPAFTLASDRSESRIHILRDNARRMGRASVGFAVADARRPPLIGADVVLVDVPCTGTGTLARHPDGRWRVSPESLRTLVELQREILSAAAEVVVPGGLLVYSTCSLEPEENEQQVDAFLRSRSDFDMEPPEGTPAKLLDGKGRLFVTPQATGWDGAFAARIRRAA